MKSIKLSSAAIRYFCKKDPFIDDDDDGPASDSVEDISTYYTLYVSMVFGTVVVLLKVLFFTSL